ncbi:MAG: YjbQ family protein [Ignavibacteria bacterium]|nr:YjbQ family protein [Ignavibacteria bacterium]
MKVITDNIEFSTKGDADMIDITQEIQEIITKSGFAEGNVLVFAVGSTAGLTTIEYEPGLKRDIPEFFEKIIPSGKRYYHDDTWGDGNGHSHLRASLLGPSIQIPFKDKHLLLGTWQQIVYVDFDNHPRQRRAIVQIIGE